MGKAHTLARIGAVACSVVLVGGYIVYRAADSILPSTKSGRIAPPPNAPATGPADAPEGAEQSERALLPSSKVYTRIVPAPADAPATQPRRVLFPGSKSTQIDLDGQNVIFGDGKVVVEAPVTQPTTQPSGEPSSDARSQP